jgi:undecaprenyl-diphosphatase
MLEILKYILRGIVQGLTEFLPISSSGHLVLIENIPNFSLEGATDNHFLNVIVHFATMIAVIIVFRVRIWELIKEFFTIPIHIKNEGLRNALRRPNTRFIIAIIIGTIPTIIVGLILRKYMEFIEKNLLIVACMFLVTAIVLFLSKIFDDRAKTDETENPDKLITIKRAVSVGLAQSIAIMPGVSRSGITITTGRGVGLSKDIAASFSFILSLPAILGATVLEIADIIDVIQTNGVDKLNIDVLGTTLAFVFSLVVGVISLKFLIKFLKQGKFFYFGFYVLAISIVCFVMAFMSIV